MMKGIQTMFLLVLTTRIFVDAYLLAADDASLCGKTLYADQAYHDTIVPLSTVSFAFVMPGNLPNDVGYKMCAAACKNLGETLHEANGLVKCQGFTYNGFAIGESCPLGPGLTEGILSDEFICRMYSDAPSTVTMCTQTGATTGFPCGGDSCCYDDYKDDYEGYSTTKPNGCIVKPSCSSGEYEADYEIHSKDYAGGSYGKLCCERKKLDKCGPDKCGPALINTAINGQSIGFISLVGTEPAVTGIVADLDLGGLMFCAAICDSLPACKGYSVSGPTARECGTTTVQVPAQDPSGCSLYDKAPVAANLLCNLDTISGVPCKGCHCPKHYVYKKYAKNNRYKKSRKYNNGGDYGTSYQGGDDYKSHTAGEGYGGGNAGYGSGGNGVYGGGGNGAGHGNEGGYRRHSHGPGRGSGSRGRSYGNGSGGGYGIRAGGGAYGNKAGEGAYGNGGGGGAYGNGAGGGAYGNGAEGGYGKMNGAKGPTYGNAAGGGAYGNKAGGGAYGNGAEGKAYGNGAGGGAYGNGAEGGAYGTGGGGGGYSNYKQETYENYLPKNNYEKKPDYNNKKSGESSYDRKDDYNYQPKNKYKKGKKSKGRGY